MKTKCNRFQNFLLVAVSLQALASEAQPVITNQPATQAVVWGGNATFSVMVTGTGPFSYQWQLNGTNLPNNIITTVAGGNLFNNQPATNTILNSAAGVAMDNAGNLFIADAGNHVIRKVDTNGVATIVAGNGSASYSGDGGAATNAGLWGPLGVLVDSAGNLFISDSSNNRIRKVNTSGIISTYAGNGTAGYSGDGGNATAARLWNPEGLTMDASTNLYIAEFSNHRIRKIGLNGKIATVAGTGTPTYTTDGISATSANLSYPRGVAVDASSNLFIADSGNSRIRKVNSSGIIFTVAGNGIAGYSGDGGAATNAKINIPSGVCVDAAGNLYISDGLNHRIRKVGTNNVISTFAGNGTNSFFGDGGNATNASLSFPEALVLDTVGNLLVADYYNNRVRKVTTNGFIATVAGRALNDSAPALNASLNVPGGICFDAADNLYIADAGNNCIRKVDANGIITTAAGNYIDTYSKDGIQATNSSLNNPSGVAVGPSGSLYIADAYNSRVRKVATNGIITTVAGNGNFGSAIEFSAATNTTLSYPFGVAADTAGRLFIADTVNNRVRIVETNGIITTYSWLTDIPPSYNWFSPYDVALDSAGRTYADDSYINIVWKTDTNNVTTQVAGTINPVGGYTGDGGPATNALLAGPHGLAVDAAGNLFVSDSANVRIRKVSGNGIITTIVGNGIQGFAGDGGMGANASMSLPQGMAVDGAGNLFFADSGNNRIRKLAYVDYADQPSFTVPNVTPASASNYYSVIVTSASGSVTSSVATVSVQLPPLTAAFTASNGLYTFTWSAVSNVTYQLQCATNLAAPAWIDLGSPVTAASNAVSATDAVGADGQRFYRVRLWP